MIEEWIRRYFPEEQVSKVMGILSRYGAKPWHREPERVRRDVVILSKGSIDRLEAAIRRALTDYRDVLIGEEVDPWVVEEIRKFDS